MEHRIRFIAKSLPEPTFGEDRNDYVIRVVRSVDESSDFRKPELVEAARLKYNWMQVQDLIRRIQGGSATATQEAIILLLEETFKP